MLDIDEGSAHTARTACAKLAHSIDSHFGALGVWLELS